MDTASLAAFLAIVDTGSFSEASGWLYLIPIELSKSADNDQLS